MFKFKLIRYTRISQVQATVFPSTHEMRKFIRPLPAQFVAAITTKTSDKLHITVIYGDWAVAFAHKFNTTHMPQFVPILEIFG